ncbi:MAG: 50S ribosomal protein L10 [Oscillospiraceae bacterium]|nr:50S ribosomal protein L10 [Oscillospiraceae bacterium]
MPSGKILGMKKEVVREIAGFFSESKAMVIADYRGLTVEQDTEMRAALRKANVGYKVIKNSMASLAAKESGIDGLDAYLTGPTAVAYSAVDPVAPARLMAEYGKKYAKLEVKGGVLEGKVIGLGDVRALSEMPPKETLLSMVVGTLGSPIGGLVNVLNANVRGLACALKAIAEARGA